MLRVRVVTSSPPHSGPGQRLAVFYNLQDGQRTGPRPGIAEKMGDPGGEGCVWCWCDGPASVQHPASSRAQTWFRARDPCNQTPVQQSFFFPWEANVLVNGMTMCHCLSGLGNTLGGGWLARGTAKATRNAIGGPAQLPTLDVRRLRITAAIMWSTGRGLHGHGMGASWVACGCGYWSKAGESGHHGLTLTSRLTPMR
ncbi:hypothetical protein V8C34DRAFT_222593 [Trichoderma compactum]